PAVRDQLSPVADILESKGISVKIHTVKNGEPSFTDFREVITEARYYNADSIAGIGGGSVMDVAKLVAALLETDQQIIDVVGSGLLKERSTYLICIPTTSGTGSEVSPNAILINENDGSKQGIISSFLVPDSAYVDPALTLSLPASVTAYTGIDALTHCIEAYTNRFAHPMADILALEGIRLISHNLKTAVNNGQDLEARTNLALGSVYGGMCLGPVNTAAIHALAYPLGSDFKIAHGLSNALLLPYVMEFNFSAAEKRYADIAIAMGAEKGVSDYETALNGISLIKELLKECNLPSRLSAIGVPLDAVNGMARSAMNVQRLLKNNVREVNLENARTIYTTAY
ncbi:MAG: iron-containing alcohol dehydrogenase, partial [Bacteroidales bacterium]